MEINGSLDHAGMITWKSEQISCYVLGTAQLGMDYGIANSAGKPSQDEADAIVDAAYGAGCNVFDTAQGYGDSEKVLGTSLSGLGLGKKVKVVSKLDPSRDPANASWVGPACERSRALLGVDQLWCMMLHRASWLDYFGGGMGQQIRATLEDGTVCHAGVSVYDTDELSKALNIKEMEIIQVPCNLWDPDVLTGGWLNHVTDATRLIFARSIFLQGLLLLPPNRVKERLPSAYHASLCWEGICRDLNLSALDTCLRFAATLCAHGVAVVLGAEDAKQAKMNTRFETMKPFEIGEVAEIHKQLIPYLNADIINPAKWSRKS